MATTTTSISWQKKLFIQMSSAPGSGKSTLATQLQQALSSSGGGSAVVVLDHDILRSSLLEDNDDDDDDNNGTTFDQIAKSAYRLQWALAEQMAKQGLSVIIDSPCNFPEVLDRGSEIAERYGLVYWYVECSVDGDVGLLDERMRARAPMRSQRTGIDRPPTAAAGAAIETDKVKGDAPVLLRCEKKWMKTPCRPEQNAIIVDSTGGDLEMRRDYILERIALTQNSALASEK